MRVEYWAKNLPMLANGVEDDNELVLFNDDVTTAQVSRVELVVISSINQQGQPSGLSFDFIPY